MKKIKFAVVSDLHCHPEREKGNENCTWLYSDLLRDDSSIHPVQSFIDFYNRDLSKEFNEIDFILCPGDFTNYSDKQGFISGWSYIHELSNLFQAKKIYATLGNHDIDSRYIHSKYHLTIPKGIKRNFPIPEDEIGTFWDKGYAFIETDSTQLLIVNSTHYHTTTHSSSSSPIENPTVKGHIAKSSIIEIDNYIQGSNSENKIKIMMCHHHPIQHSENGQGPYDFIENGEELVSTLAKHKYDLVIHGHKHYPKLKNYLTDNGNITILSSGSFSATNQISFSSKFNYLHLIEIEKQTNVSRGTVKTPNYKNQIGWENSSDGFDYFTGFGSVKTTQQILAEIYSILEQDPMPNWSYLCDQIEDLKFLTPIDLKSIINDLERKEMGVNRDKSGYPTVIYNNHKIKALRDGN